MTFYKLTIIISIGLFGAFNSLFGQLYFGANYQAMPNQSWQTNNQVSSNHRSYAGIELGYITSIKNIRWDIIPSAFIATGSLSKGYTFGVQRMGVVVHNHIYPFSFYQDCNCPDFKSRGNTYDKSFFVKISPGAAYNNIHNFFDDNYSEKTKGFNYQVGLGAGFDFKVNKNLLITPSINYVLSTRLKRGIGNDQQAIYGNVGGIQIGITSQVKFPKKYY